MSAPDWARLGAKFGEPDVRVAFPFPAAVTLSRGPDAPDEPLAEKVIALREGAEGVTLQLACDLFLHVTGARIEELPEELDRARLVLGPRARPRVAPRRRRSRD